MIVVVIPAKGDSTRLPNKNLAVVGGRPLLDHAIGYAKESSRIDAIFVSTDSDEIAAHAAARGVAVIRRPSSLGGDVPLLDVYRHALDQIPRSESVRVIIGLQADHPDRTVTLDDALRRFDEESVDVLYSTEADGTKNGAHYILSRSFVESGVAGKKAAIVDDCTNVHFEADLRRAEARIAARDAKA